jgi:hypothetical protein
VVRADELLRQLQQGPLARCRAHTYVLASQPGVNAADFVSAATAPFLHQSVFQASSPGARAAAASRVAHPYHGGGSGAAAAAKPAVVGFDVPDVYGGSLGVDELERFLRDKCDAELMKIDPSSACFFFNQILPFSPSPPFFFLLAPYSFY